jgi:hypothetical protein
MLGLKLTEQKLTILSSICGVDYIHHSIGVLYINNNNNNVRKGDTCNKRDNWNHLKIIQTIHEQNNVKARHQGTTDNSRMWLCVHNSEIANVKVQNICREEITLQVV